MTDIFVAPSKPKQAGLGSSYETVAARWGKGKKRGGHAFSAFCLLPGKVRFETQEKHEKIILLLRQHWFTQLKWIITAVIMVFVPLILTLIPLLDFLSDRGQLMAIIMWYLLLIAFVYEQFISWYFHVFIITDERVIDVNFYNLLYKEVSGAKIDNIEDITYRQGGVIRALLNFGDVNMQTAGEKREFAIDDVPSPGRVVQILNELKLEEEHEKIIGRVR
ncbi:MAG: PH domain-containing protein [Patescibacteria group bacterium]|nr:PH domain-containing protein [Patescibacteria group bacterium]